MAHEQTEEKGTEGISYSRVLHIEGRIADDNAGHESLLTLMRERAPDVSVFDEFPAYLFNGQISSSVWDTYDTRMGLSTLKNYAAEAAKGVAFIRGHRAHSTDPIGQSLTGQFVGGQGNGVARVTSDWYVLRDPDSAVFVDRMRSGVIRDLSVGFHGGEWLCSICGKDMQQWMVRDGCRHILGMVYQPRDEAGTPTGEPVKARATIENAHLSEYSGVFDGSTPDCVIAKARSLAAEGILRGRERELVEVRYRIHLPGDRASVPVGKPQTEDEGMSDEFERQMTEVRAALKKAGIADDKPAPEAIRGLHEALKAATDHSDLTSLLTRAGVPEGKSVDEGIRHLSDELTRLRPLADDGTTYRKDLIDAAVVEGTRAMGKDFKEETQRAWLAKQSLDDIKLTTEQWRKIGDALFPGGRSTTDDASERATPLRRAESVSAYKV